MKKQIEGTVSVNTTPPADPVEKQTSKTKIELLENLKFSFLVNLELLIKDWKYRNIVIGQILKLEKNGKNIANEIIKILTI